MPMVLTASVRSKTDEYEKSLYEFADKHKAAWRAFWLELEGDVDKVVSWAKKAGVKHPEAWTEALHRFLFGVYSTDQRNFKSIAASKTFASFLEKVAKEHVKTPKDKWWYINQGTTEDGFVEMLNRASLFEDEYGAIKYLNSRIRDYGALLYSEFLLTKVPNKQEIRSLASQLNEKAYEIEKQAGIDILADLDIGKCVAHSLFPNEIFDVVSRFTADDKDVIAVEDDNGQIGYVLDQWNLSLIK